MKKNPADQALREKAVALARKIKPAPAIPKEAEKRMIRGAAAIQAAASPVDFRGAAEEFEKATLEAPWWGDAYYNLAVAQDKAGDYDAALRSLKLATLASPGNKDAEQLSYAVEFRKEKSGPEAIARALSRKWVSPDIKHLHGYTRLSVSGGEVTVMQLLPDGPGYKASDGSEVLLGKAPLKGRMFSGDINTRPFPGFETGFGEGTFEGELLEDMKTLSWRNTSGSWSNTSKLVPLE